MKESNRTLKATSGRGDGPQKAAILELGRAGPIAGATAVSTCDSMKGHEGDQLGMRCQQENNQVTPQQGSSTAHKQVIRDQSARFATSQGLPLTKLASHSPKLQSARGVVSIERFPAHVMEAKTLPYPTTCNGPSGHVRAARAATLPCSPFGAWDVHVMSRLAHSGPFQQSIGLSRPS